MNVRQYLYVMDCISTSLISDGIYAEMRRMMRAETERIFQAFLKSMVVRPEPLPLRVWLRSSGRLFIRLCRIHQPVWSARRWKSLT
jgi:hypothetical protein